MEANDAFVDPRNNHGVSWRAIAAGALGAAALSLVLILLGLGFGFSAVSPWLNAGISTEALGISAIIWLALTQIAASGLGGYLAGRLRVRWANVQDDEVFFRDTAHGFLAWSLATLLTAALIFGSLGGALNSGVQAGASVASGVAEGATSAVGQPDRQGNDDSLGYYVDSLFRSEPQSLSLSPDQDQDQAVRAEALRIFIRNSDSAGGQLNPEDKQYLGGLVAQRTNLNQAQAEQRVEEIYQAAMQMIEEAQAAIKSTADEAREAAAWSSLWMFVALLCGAFVASLAATFGGKQRDQLDYS